MFFLHLKIGDFAKNFKTSEIWKRWEREKKIIKKQEQKKVRAEGSSPDGQVDFLLDFCLAERKTISRVYISTSSQGD